MQAENERSDAVSSWTRRELLSRSLHGAAGLGLVQALGAAGFFAGGAAAAPARGAFVPRAGVARHCIYLFMTGGPSQMDLFDPKPELQKRDGQSIRTEVRRGEFKESQILGSRRSFQRYGATEQWCADLLPALATQMDKLAVVKSLYTDSFAHGSALLQMNSGQILQGHPSMGAWVTYGLGTDCANLPGFVVMHDPRGGPISGPANWSAGYMPAAYQGTLFRASGDPLLDLRPAPNGSARAAMTRDMARRWVDFVRELDGQHAAVRPGTSELAARAQTYELAHEMVESAAEALDIDSEDADTRALYGLDLPAPDHALAVGPAPFGRQCLIARRLVERGVRFVQIYHGGGHQQQTWDAHHGVEENLAIHCPEIDQPVAGLLQDLERRGLLSETLVLWGGEFGRTSVSQKAVADQQENPGGRDHNPEAFTMWLAGAGVRPGSYGATDELGGRAVENRHHVRDLHATVLHLMGLDHAKLTYEWGGLERKLTGVIEAHPVEAVMA